MRITASVFSLETPTISWCKWERGE